MVAEAAAGDRHGHRPHGHAVTHLGLSGQRELRRGSGVMSSEVSAPFRSRCRRHWHHRGAGGGALGGASKRRPRSRPRPPAVQVAGISAF